METREISHAGYGRWHDCVSHHAAVFVSSRNALPLGLGVSRGSSKKFNRGRLRPEFQPLNLFYTIFDGKGTPFVYLLLIKKKYPLHIPSLELCISSLSTAVNPLSLTL